MSSNAQPFVLPPDTPITCPHCEKKFELEEGFAKRALDALEASSSKQLAQVRADERAAAERQAQRVDKERDELHAKALAKVKDATAKSFAPEIEAMRKQLAKSQKEIDTLAQREATLAQRERGLDARVAEAASKQAAQLVAGERQAHAEQIKERDQQLADARNAELVLRKDKRAVEDRAAALELEVARKLDEGRADIEAKAKASEAERSGLEKAELLKTIADMRTQLVEAQRKADQGSQQLQGEVLELAIEESLRRAFPLDTIEEVKKGQRGGDVIHRVMTRSGQEAGVILWETKRASGWQPSWTTKLKEDMRTSGAVVGILVTMPGALPKEWEPGCLFALHEEVWVTHTSTAVGIAEALRSGLLEVQRQRVLSAGKGEKAEALFEYLTSPQFANKLKGVYGAFKTMREELESERNVTQQRWARREKQLQTGVAQLLGVAGDIQGLSQHEIPALELEVQRLESEDN